MTGLHREKQGAQHPETDSSVEGGVYGALTINIHNETGLVVPPSDPLAFRAAMRTLWDNPLQALAMGQKAALRYEQLFTAEQMGRQMAKIYREVVAEKPAR